MCSRRWEDGCLTEGRRSRKTKELRHTGTGFDLAKAELPPTTTNSSQWNGEVPGGIWREFPQ